MTRLRVIASAMRRGYAHLGVRLFVEFTDGRRAIY